LSIEKIYNIDIDIVDNLTYPIMDFVQGDSLNKIVITLTNAGQAIKNLDIYNYKIMIKRPDGVLVYKIPQILNNKIEYKIGTYDLEKSGICAASLEIYDGLYRITTRQFSFYISKSLTDIDEVESDSKLHIQYDYRDLANLPEIPTSTSDLENDSGFITIDDVPTGGTSDYNDLINKPEIPSTPEDIGAEPAFTKNTAFNKNFGNEAGTVAEGNALNEVASSLAALSNQLGSAELETTAQNVTEAINEIKAIEAAAAGIDDAQVSSVLTWSSDQLNRIANDNDNFYKKGLTGADTLNFLTRDTESPIITFIDDDGRAEVYSRLYQIFEGKGKKFVASICPNLLGTATYMTEANVEELHMHGHELINHTFNHYPYANDDITWENEIRQGKEWLYKKGYSHDIFIQPQGAGFNGTALEIVKKYAKCAFNGTGHNSAVNLPTFNIVRIDYSSAATKTLDYYKSVVDACLAGNTWLVFMVHTWAQTLEQDTILGQLIDYINTLNIEIVTASEGFSRKANKLEIAGNVIFDRKGGYDFGAKYIVETADSRTNAALITDFTNGRITVTQISTGYLTTGGFPFASGGVLTTNRLAGGNYPGYHKQYYDTYQTNELWFRSWNADTSAWNAWVKISPISAVTAVKSGSFSDAELGNFGTIPANGSVTKTVTITGIGFGNKAIVNPKGTITEGLTFCAWVSAADTLSIRVANCTGTGIAFTRNWDYLIV